MFKEQDDPDETELLEVQRRENYTDFEIKRTTDFLLFFSLNYFQSFDNEKTTNVVEIQQKVNTILVVRNR